jgi:hypothetical protein
MAEETRFGQPHPIEIEGSHEEGAEFRIVAKPVFRQHQRLASAFGDGPGDDRNIVVAQPWRTWPVMLPSTLVTRMHHQTLGLNI